MFIRINKIHEFNNKNPRFPKHSDHLKNKGFQYMWSSLQSC